MRGWIMGPLVFVCLLGLAGPNAAGVEVKSAAKEIKLTGRVHTQFNTTSVEGEVASEFLIRRARITAEVKLNDFVSGKVQPDFGQGKLTLKDAHMKLTYGSQLSVRIGQFKRPFDLFELTSSTKILAIERAAKIRGAIGLTSLSSLTEELGYSDRDIGVEATLQGPDKLFAITAAVTNGLGANKVPHKQDAAVGEKQFTGRLRVKPSADMDLTFGLGATARPYLLSEMQPDSSMKESAEYSTAAELDAQYGNFKNGPHIQAGAVFGENWKADPSNPPQFLAAQVIATYKMPTETVEQIEAVEPILRVSWADPDIDSKSKDDSGILITPGVQVFFIGRNKIAVNVDIFLPEASDLDTEYSIKAQSFLHF